MMGVMAMEIKIQGYWNAKMQSAQEPGNGTVEDRLKKGQYIIVCDIIIDGKLKGSVVWDGIALRIEPP